MKWLDKRGNQNGRKSYYEYIKVDGAELFTVVCLPDEVGTFPTVLFRKPYHDTEFKMTEDEVVALYHEKKEKWLARGYAFVHQHCRGRGKSTGDFVPYINERDWFDYIRGKCAAPCPVGKVSYYKMFGDTWCTDDFKQPEKSKTFTLGEGERTYRYNPYAPATFKGGLSGKFGGSAYQDKPNSRYDILSFYTSEFEEDTFIKGKMSAKLTVRSTAEDTCFYVRVSIAKEEGDIGLRDDINQISNFNPAYVPGEEQEMTFSFDEHAFVVKKGERLRVDISSSAHPYYVRHTNNRGLFSEQTTAKIADNTVILDKSSLTVYFE